MRYASRSKYYGYYGEDKLDGGDKFLIRYYPLFQDLFRRAGAVYWVNQTDAAHTAFDMNYHTMAFKAYNTDATLNGRGDACLMRLIVKKSDRKQ